MTAVYQEAIPTAELTLTGAVDIIENGATMDYWEALLKNTGEAPLTTIKIKPTATGRLASAHPTRYLYKERVKTPKLFLSPKNNGRPVQECPSRWISLYQLAVN